MKLKVFIEEAGCNRRKLDIKTIRAYLEGNDYELISSPEDADKILVATCAFKKLEEDESVQRIRHFRKYGPKIIVYGCLPDIARERYKEFADIPKVAPYEIEKIETHFPGNAKRFSEIIDSNLIARQNGGVFKSIARVIQTKPKMNREFFHRILTAGRKKIKDILFPPVAPYYLFICRGCVGKCSYCAIRRAIGPVRSKPIPTVVSEFQRGLEEGYRDFIILGDDPGCYGIDLGITFPDLLQSLFNAKSEIDKSKKDSGGSNREIAFHINEIHPKFFIPYTDQLLEMEGFSSVRSILCPVQSGSNRILELMQREHTAEQFEETVKKIQSKRPQIAFNTQLIIGYPSETEEDFQKTLESVVRCKFNYVVVFPYDDKDGTDSSLQPDKIPADVIEKRVRKAFSYFAKKHVTAYYKCP
jgi:threonylcarbamoyladenosine tRNA methylthiotransferase CDKAL1